MWKFVFVFVLSLFSLFSSAENSNDFVSFGGCGDVSRLTLYINTCYKVKELYNYGGRVGLYEMCLFNEFAINEKSTLFDFLCPGCNDESDYKASIMLSHNNTILNSVYFNIDFFNDVNCDMKIKTNSLYSYYTNISTSTCPYCYNYQDGKNYNFHRRYNDSNMLSFTPINSASSSFNEALYAISALGLIILIPLACICLLGTCLICLIICCGVGVILVIFTLFIMAGLTSLSAVGGLISWRVLKTPELRILQPLGKGSNATVYQALFKGEICAAKEYQKGFKKDDVEEFSPLQEIEILSSLNHPNICGYIGNLKKNGNRYLLIHYYPKGDLRTYLNTKKLTVAEQQVIIADIAEGLKYLKEKGILHRDLSCRNIFLTEDMHAVIGDFGLSIKKDNEEKFSSLSIEQLPIRWSAPESFNGIFSYNSEIFMFSRMIYELSTGKMPFAGFDDTIVYDLIINQKYNLDYSIVENVNLRNLLKKMSSFEEEERMTIEQVITYLKKLDDEYIDIETLCGVEAEYVDAADL